MILLYELTDKYLNKDSTVLDLGCGRKEYSDRLKCKKIVTVDAWEKLKPDLLIDLENTSILESFTSQEFDLILCIDLIEHLTKDAGIRLINDMKIVGNKILILTPLWWDDNSKHTNDPNLWCYGNEYNIHKCLWTKEELIKFKFIEEEILPNYFVGVWARN